MKNTLPVKRTGLDFIVECEACKKKISLNGGDVIGNMSPIINGNQYFLTYYDCPSCHRRHFVQVDDTKSKQQLAGVTVQLAKLARARNRGKGISKKQSDKFTEARQHLSDYRMALMRELTGKSVTDEAGTTFTLRFRV